MCTPLGQEGDECHPFSHKVPAWGCPVGLGGGDKGGAKGTQLLAWEKSSIKALRWRRGSALGGGWGRFGIRLRAASWLSLSWHGAAGFSL